MTSWLEVGKTYTYDSWVYVVVCTPGPSGIVGTVEVLCLTDYSSVVKAGHLIEVMQNSVAGRYSVQVA